jgi:hypothetical protein
MLNNKKRTAAKEGCGGHASYLIANCVSSRLFDGSTTDSIERKAREVMWESFQIEDSKYRLRCSRDSHSFRSCPIRGETIQIMWKKRAAQMERQTLEEICKVQLEVQGQIFG